METLYLICLLVGGFFVALSLFGGDEGVGGSEVDVEADLDISADADVDLGDVSQTGSGSGFVDLFSIRALFLFAAFFGLTGVALSLLESGEPFTAIVSVLVGLIVGLGGNYIIRRVAYDRVSSDFRTSDLRGLTGRVILPFDGERRGKISVVAGGQRLQLVARGFGGEAIEEYNQGDEVVVVRMDGSVAEVVKPE